ncbi:MAG: SRPBCC family protein [Methylovirgula sp.]
MKKLLTFSVGSAALVFSCLPAFAIESSYKADSTVSVADMWKKIGGFCDIANWHPAVAKCDLSTDGKERTLSLKGGGTIVEDLVKWSDKAHSYTYKIKTSPLPVEGYVSTIKVTAHGKGSVVSWSGHYKAKGAPPAKAKEAIDGIYKSGVDALVK